MFSFALKLIRELKLARDVRKMLYLANHFKNEVRAFAIRHGHENNIDVEELRILGAFVIAETYLVGRPKDRECAELTLDRCHAITARALFHSDEKLMQEFFTKTRTRYAEYRKIVFDENGLWRKGPKPLFALAEHSVSQFTRIDADVDLRDYVVHMIGMAVLDHMTRCSKAFMR